MKKKILAGVLAAAICAGAFAATDHTGAIYGSLGLGGYFNHSYSQSGPEVNVIAGYVLNKNLDAQLSLNYFGNNQKTAMVEGIWNFANHSKLTPYVSLGTGYTHLTTDSMGINAGLGVRYELAPNAFASVDYRYLQSFGSKTPNGSSLMLGLGVYFGGASASSAYAQGPVSSQQQAKREAYYQSNYVLPKDIKECLAGTSELTRESVGCYTVDGSKATMHLDSKFAYNSYALNASSKRAIDNLINFINQYNFKNVEVRGYASQGKTGPAYAEYNQKLSVKRAEAVKSYMISKGLNANEVKAVGFGYTKPLVPNTTKENQSINQRVEVSITAPLKTQQ